MQFLDIGQLCLGSRRVMMTLFDLLLDEGTVLEGSAQMVLEQPHV